MPVVSRPCGERVLALAVRTAMLNFVLVAGSASAWAASGVSRAVRTNTGFSAYSGPSSAGVARPDQRVRTPPSGVRPLCSRLDS